MDRDAAIGARRHLFNALAILASPAEAQVDWLKRIKTFPSTDELAIEFDDWAALLPQLVEARLMDESASIAVRAVEAIMDRIQQSDLWSLDELATAPLWAEARTAAGKALVQLLEPAPVNV